MKLLQEVLEGVSGHPKYLQSLHIIPDGLSNMQPLVLAVPAGPEVAGMEAQEALDNPGGGVQENIIRFPARVCPAGQSPGGSCMVAGGLGQCTKAGQAVIAC